MYVNAKKCLETLNSRISGGWVGGCMMEGEEGREVGVGGKGVRRSGELGGRGWERGGEDVGGKGEGDEKRREGWRFGGGSSVQDP